MFSICEYCGQKEMLKYMLCSFSKYPSLILATLTFHTPLIIASLAVSSYTSIALSMPSYQDLWDPPKKVLCNFVRWLEGKTVVPFYLYCWNVNTFFHHEKHHGFVVLCLILIFLHPMEFLNCHYHNQLFLKFLILQCVSHEF
jgi:hypothetical protein